MVDVLEIAKNNYVGIYVSYDIDYCFYRIRMYDELDENGFGKGKCIERDLQPSLVCSVSGDFIVKMTLMEMLTELNKES